MYMKERDTKINNESCGRSSFRTFKKETEVHDPSLFSKFCLSKYKKEILFLCKLMVKKY